MQKFVNDIDPITLEEFEDIPPENIIRLTVNNKLRFYNVRALYEWFKINPVDPSTKAVFSVHQQRKIRKVYEKSVEQNIYNCIKNFIKDNPPLTLPSIKIPKNIEKIKKQIVVVLSIIDDVDLSLINKIDKDDCKMIGNALGMRHGDIKNILDFARTEFVRNPDMWENLFQSLIKK